MNKTQKDVSINDILRQRAPEKVDEEREWEDQLNREMAEGKEEWDRDVAPYVEEPLSKESGMDVVVDFKTSAARERIENDVEVMLKLYNNGDIPVEEKKKL